LKAQDEEYLNVAVTRLLPLYYSAPADEGTGRILHRMADALVARHGDTWLRDVLKTPHSAGAAEAFAALGRAVVADDSDDWDRSSADAENAVRLFRSAGSEAGALRAQFEGVYTLQMRSRFARCVSEGSALGQALGRNSYSWLRTQALLESAVCERWAGDFNQAWANHREAIQSALQSRYTVLSLRALFLRSIWQKDTGNVAAAWEGFIKGLDQFWNGSYPLVRAQHLYSELSLLAPRRSSAYSAQAWAKESVETVASLGHPLFETGALHQLALTEMLVGRHDLASGHLQQASAILAKLPGEDRQLLEVAYGIELAEAEAGLRELNEPLALLASFEADAQRSDSLSQLRYAAVLGRLRLRQDNYAEAKDLLERALQIGASSRAILPEADRLPWVRATGDIYRALVECAIQSGSDARQSWELWSRYRAALFNQVSAANIGGDVVARGEGILSFAELPSGVAAWLGTPRGFYFRWLDPETKVLHDATDRLVRGFANPRSPEAILREDARQLSHWLLDSWDSQLDAVQTVVIESDGPLSSLPWPALVRVNGRYWSEDFAIRIRVGAGRSAALSPRLASAKRILAVGEPAISGDQDLPPLPDAEREAKNVSSWFSRPVLLEGPEATLSEVRNHLEAVEVFHFAGHGYGGDGGGLILRGGDGGPALLTAAEIQDLHLSRCQLAVLSGCATGSGERDGPGDPQSLVWAFLHAGAREVVASLWNLDSAGTQVFMSEFYTAMFSGATADQSLRRAAAAVRAKAEYRHPYYWAGLQVFDVQ
jgi:CHAT domain-containing protein/tetratricopeptide (TPR) repeat protein